MLFFYLHFARLGRALGQVKLCPDLYFKYYMNQGVDNSIFKLREYCINFKFVKYRGLQLQLTNMIVSEFNMGICLYLYFFTYTNLATIVGRGREKKD